MARLITVNVDNISIGKHGDLDTGDQVKVSDEEYAGLLATGRFSDGTLTDGGEVADPGEHVRATATHTTSSLAAAASETGTVEIAAVFIALRVTTSAPARVRLYASAAQRDADVARGDVDPTGNHGVLLEVVTTAEMLTVDLAPVPIGWTADESTAVPITVTNTDVTAQSVTTTLTYLGLE